MAVWEKTRNPNFAYFTACDWWGIPCESLFSCSLTSESKRERERGRDYIETESVLFELLECLRRVFHDEGEEKGLREKDALTSSANGKKKGKPMADLRTSSSFQIPFISIRQSVIHSSKAELTWLAERRRQGKISLLKFETMLRVTLFLLLLLNDQSNSNRSSCSTQKGMMICIVCLPLLLQCLAR